MNIESLRHEYQNLTPFERACLNISNATSPHQSNAIADALTPPNQAHLLSQEIYQFAIISVTAQACIKGYQYQRSSIYAHALLRLEQETGAAFAAAAKLFQVDLEKWVEQDEYLPKADMEQAYAYLLQIWQVLYSPFKSSN